MKKKILVLVCAACGIGKSTLIDYLRDNNLINGFCAVDTDEVGLNWWDYADTDNPDLYTTDSIKEAIKMSKENHLIFGSCLNPLTLFEKIDIPSEVKNIYMIALTCSPDEITTRLKARDPERMCSDDAFIQAQINYNDWFLRNANKFQLHIDNSNKTVQEAASEVKTFLDMIL